MALSIQQVSEKVSNLIERNAARDSRMKDITEVRRGNMEAVYPDMFPEGMSKPMIANFVDIAARDVAEVLAPLPSVNCSSINSKKDADKKAADKRSLIANNYVQFSKLQTQMYTGADWYNTYAFLPFVVEPDFQARMPRIRIESPMGAYPEFDRYGRCVSFTKKYLKSINELVQEFPEYETQIIGQNGREFQNMNVLLELIRYEDADQVTLFLPQRGNTVLRSARNPLGKVSVAIARRPGIDPDDPRGQFDDVLWVQIARARFSLLAMEAAEKSVQAPIVVPQDLSEFSFGPDAVLRTANPAGVRRVGLELPPGAFQEQQMLENEMRIGSRYPEGRSGTINASVITGSGVQALMGGFDSQIKAGQMILAEALETVFNLCFEMDEKLFAGEKSQVGVFQGAPYMLKYDPAKDIKGEYSCQVNYGLMAGLNPNQALMFSLQALQANLVSKDFIMQELPWNMNVSREQERIDIERMRDSLSASLASVAQAIPQMASQGQDPSDIIRRIADTISKRREGASIEEAVAAAFPPPAPVEAPPAPTVTESLGGATPPAPATPTPPAGPAVAQQAQPTPPPDIATILSQIGGGA